MLKRILLVGGDERALRMLPLWQAEGCEVQTLGLRAEDEREADIGAADALLFPYPFAVRACCVPTLSGLTLHPEDVLKHAKCKAVVIAGNGLEFEVLAANEAGKQLRLIHYMRHEPFLQTNAELSAEAAVYETMRQTPAALMGMKLLVTGYGRFARALAKRLYALGALVWVAARREEQRLLAASDGMHAVTLEAIAQIAPQMRIVLNTIPARVIGEDALHALPPDACLLELASAPYGFDRTQAEALKLHCEVLPALPARYAPQSAAQALLHASVRLLSEEMQ
ncbi:MAG: NAD(P)-dependent oxidoreductase [Clostridia bacterium]